MTFPGLFSRKTISWTFSIFYIAWDQPQNKKHLHIYNGCSWTWHYVITLLALPSLCQLTLPEKCPYWEIFWSVCSHIRTEYGNLLSESPYSVRIRKNTDQKNSAYRYFLRHVIHTVYLMICHHVCYVSQ